MVQFEIQPEGPYDFERMRARLRNVGHEMYRHEDDALVRTIRVQGKPYLIRIRSEGGTDRSKLAVEAEGPDAGRQQPAIMAHLKHMLSIETDIRDFYALLAQDPVLAALGERYYGFRLILESDPFECMVKTIIGQQLNLAFAATLTRRLVEHASSPFTDKGQPYPVFPTPEQIAALDTSELRELQFSQKKAEYVIDFAREVAAGRLVLEGLQAMDNAAIVEKLVRMRGIGRWTAECFLLFGLGRPDLLPAADIGLRNAVRLLYRLPEQPKEEEVRSIGASWHPWSSYVTYYMWESLNDPFFRV